MGPIEMYCPGCRCAIYKEDLDLEIFEDSEVKYENLSLHDQMKIQEFLTVFHKIKPEDLTEFLNRYK